MQEIWIQVITGAILGLISFFIYAFSMHMLKSGQARFNGGNASSAIGGGVLIVISACVLVGAPLALLLYSPIAFMSCGVVGWFYWFKNLKL